MNIKTLISKRSKTNAVGKCNSIISRINVSALTIIIVFFLDFYDVANAQVTRYVVTPTVKQYSNLGNVLIKKDHLINVLVINGEAYLDGDIYVGKTSYLDGIQMQGFGITTDASSARWKDGIVPYVILGGFNSGDEERIINAMKHIADNTNVCFRPHTDETDFIKFKKVTVQELGFLGGTSALGRKGGEQEIRLSTVNDRVIRHEICHALGVYHEQSREDRDEFVTINWDNIDPWICRFNFDKQNFFASDVGDYDFASIMHYRFDAFGRVVNGTRLLTIVNKDSNEDRSFGTGNNLSSGDITTINQMYPIEQHCSDLVKDLQAGTYLIQAINYNAEITNKFLDLDASANGDTVRLNSIFGGTTSGTGQRWKVEKIPDATLGGYTIKNKKWGTYMDADVLNTDNKACTVTGQARGTNIFSIWGRTNQEWSIIVLANLGSNKFRCKIINKKSPSMALDSRDDCGEDSKLLLYHNNNSDPSQEFIFEQK